MAGLGQVQVPAYSSTTPDFSSVLNVPAGGGGGARRSGGSSFGAQDILGGLGGLLSIFGGIQQSNAESQAIGGLSDSLSQLTQQESGLGSGLIGDWQHTVSPELQQYFKDTMGQEGGSLGTMGGFAGGAAGLGGATAGAAMDLSKFNALSPEQIATLQLQSGNAAHSAAQTFGSEMGGTANPAALAGQLETQAGQTADSAGVGLGGVVAGQQLGAKEASLGGLGSAAGIFSGLSGQYSGLGQSQLAQALAALGIQGQGLGTGAGLLQSATGTTGNTLQGAMQSAQQSNSGGGGLGGALGGIMSIGSLFGL